MTNERMDDTPAQVPTWELLRSFVDSVKRLGIKEWGPSSIVTPVFEDGHGYSVTPLALFLRAADELESASHLLRTITQTVTPDD